MKLCNGISCLYTLLRPITGPPYFTGIGMLQERTGRDKNRCGIVISTMSNEITPGKDRTTAIKSIVKLSRPIDFTRLIFYTSNHVKYKRNTVAVDDTLSRPLDVFALNEYRGNFNAWPPSQELLIGNISH